VELAGTSLQPANTETIMITASRRAKIRA